MNKLYDYIKELHQDLSTLEDTIRRTNDNSLLEFHHLRRMCLKGVIRRLEEVHKETL